MKILFSLTLFILAVNISFAVEPLCKSTSGDFLSFRVTSNPELSFGEKNREYYTQIRKELEGKYKILCSSEKKSDEIINEMFQACGEAIKIIKSNKVRDAYMSACDIAYRAAKSFVEGSESSVKCEEKGSISNLSRAAKDISRSKTDETSNTSGASSVPK